MSCLMHCRLRLCFMFCDALLRCRLCVLCLRLCLRLCDMTCAIERDALAIRQPSRLATDWLQ